MSGLTELVMVVMVVDNAIMVMFDNNHHPSSGFHAADCRATLSQAKLLQGCLRCKILLHIFSHAISHHPLLLPILLLLWMSKFALNLDLCHPWLCYTITDSEMKCFH